MSLAKMVKYEIGSMRSEMILRHDLEVIVYLYCT